MLMPARKRALAQHTIFQLQGIVFIIVVSLLLGLSIAVYKKAFTPVERVTLVTTHTGNQLSPPADVKLRGLIVGEVRGVRSTGEQAEIDLALNPDFVNLIPSNVSARLTPKTLFGEKYVELIELEAAPAARPIRAGDVIPQDRSEVAIETEQVLDNLFPLLRAVRPADLSMTLNALSTALEGRGEQIGENIERVEAYFGQLNQHLPAMKEDIALLAQFADTYADAAPDLLRILRNATFSSRTLVEKQNQLNAFFVDTTGTANVTRRFVAANEDRIIRLARVSRPTLDVMAAYSPSYPCFLAGMVRQIPLVNKTLRADPGRAPALHLDIEVTQARPPYQPGVDDPKLEPEKMPGPTCRGLPNNPIVPGPDEPFGDGVDSPNYASGGPLGRALSGALIDPTSGYAGTEGERQIVSALLAPTMGMPADEVPALATLLFGPIARGTVVSAS
jgi:phospholipid/cholesterol/gamma-HCH transport system substrate-binding protein